MGKLIQGHRILSADEFRAISELKARLDESERWRIQQDNAATAACESVKEQAKAEGYAEGLKKLYTETKAISETLKQRVATEHDLLCQLVTDSVAKILGNLSPEVLTPKIVQAAVTQVAESTTRCTVWINPAVADAVREQLNNADWDLSLHVETSNEIDPTDCQIQTPLGVIDAGLHTQLETLSTALRDSGDTNES